MNTMTSTSATQPTTICDEENNMFYSQTKVEIGSKKVSNVETNET
jgi:hypothetical protein